VGDTTCPSCGTELADGQTVAGRKELGRQNVSICRGCGEIVILGKTEHGLMLRPATASEYLSLPEEAQTLLRVAFVLVKRPRRSTRTSRHLN
jgi:ssDNA-binding Zn-finger/Zn-ribbon topoisomerase 1